MRKTSIYAININSQRQDTMNEYYTYAYLREDGTPYYIGKGKSKRIYDYHRRKNGINLKPDNKEKIIFLKKNLTEQEAIKHEIYMIAVFGRKDLETGILRNMTNGGDGISGYSHTQESKKKISKKGKDNPFYGKKHTQETIDKMKKMWETRKVRPHSEETKLKMSESHKKFWERSGRDLNGKNNPFYGKNHSNETLEKLRKPRPHMKGAYWWNDGQIEKRSVECPGTEWTKGRLKK